MTPRHVRLLVSSVILLLAITGAGLYFLIDLRGMVLPKPREVSVSTPVQVNQMESESSSVCIKTVVECEADGTTTTVTTCCGWAYDGVTAIPGETFAQCKRRHLDKVAEVQAECGQ